ncbi:metal ABC transporter ATP-binding protein [Olsenella sp. HMSC062G07]|uniref:metal ABC transporter ATP-binding protein n=1 Tax=Olsenella sp. HMSC062G07 TaxID=1739330 RepID=UPI0008A12030|nr:metal ABC transporter ATP-binding protein [Olsenella sp. HMSC062G07]OFK24857.1 ABC transporter [Olsenella sp. HMSC062G07]
MSDVLSGAPAIGVDDVSYRYAGSREWALRGVSLQLAPGSLCALVGANGAGKSTLFKLLVGQLTPQRGRVSYDGRDVNAVLGRGLVGYVPQRDATSASFPLCVEDVAMMGRYALMGLTRTPRDADRRAVEEALRRCDLWELRQRQVGELSGGQAKRMFVARGIAQGARHLLLDEPFAGVDKRSEATIAGLLRELAQDGVCVLAAVHDLRMAATSFDEAALLDRTVICQGPARQALSPAAIERAFGVDARFATGMVA